ncbi:MAG: AAA family ATPase, partial [Planctomycetia bacterium]|nr:AAA family ATPase [Planctomycetia bacterium]
RTSIHASGQGSQALPSIQPPLHLISLVNTQLTVTLAHLSPPAHLDLRCCSSFLSAPDNQQDKPPEKPKLYILDEAGMVSSADMDALLKLRETEGASLLVTGDPRQIESVGAGQPLDQMLDTQSIKYVTIDEIQRQKDLHLRELSLAFARGDAKTAVELLTPYMVQVACDADNREEVLAARAASEYLLLDKGERGQTLVLAGTNKTRLAINAAVRLGLKAGGELGQEEIEIRALDKLSLTDEAATRAESYTPDAKKGQPKPTIILTFNIEQESENGEVIKKGSQWQVSGRNKQILTLTDVNNPEKTISINPAHMQGMDAGELRKMKLSIKDEVVFRKNDTERGIYNGLTGAVQSIDEETQTAVIRTRLGKDVSVSFRKLEVLDHAYCRTVHSSQGATFERVIAVGEAVREYMANLAYVACSRERRHLMVITDDIGKLKTRWGKYAEKTFALVKSRMSTSDDLIQVQKARFEAEKELGQVGDLEKKRGYPIITKDDQKQEVSEPGGVQEQGQQVTPVSPGQFTSDDQPPKGSQTSIIQDTPPPPPPPPPQEVERWR